MTKYSILNTSDIDWGVVNKSKASDMSDFRFNFDETKVIVEWLDSVTPELINFKLLSHEDVLQEVSSENWP